jgi:hypothetical protein
MENWLFYIGKSALAAGAFYLAFLVLFQNGKQFVFNRIYLPVSFALSFIIPLITFTTINYVEPAAPVSSGYSFLPETIQPAEIVRPSFSFGWYHYLFGIYILGTTGFLLHLLTGHFNALQIIRKSRMMRLFTHWVHVTAKDIHPFSFFNSIVLSEKTLSNPNLRLIVTHEKIHVQEKHTLDILLAEILFLLQWFNPFAWLIKDAVKNNLEYKTDEQVAKTTDVKTYQLAMVALADKKGVAPFLTAMNGSQLKNRIIMMKKKTENRYAWLKQLVVLPLLAVLVMGLANREVKTEFISYGEQIENHSKYDFSKMKIVVDGEMIPTNSPELKNIELTKENNYNGRIVIDIIEALNINLEDIITQVFSDNSENPCLYIRTKNYVPGNNKEFDEKTEPATMRAEILEKVLNKFLISIEFRQDQFILQGLEGCAFRELKFSANDKKPVAINRFGMSTEKINISPNDSGFLFEIEKTNDQINLTGNVGTTWKEISFNPASEKWFISETGVSRVNEPLIVVDGTITGYKSVDDINQAEIRSINVLEEEKAAEIYGEKGKNGVVLITTKNAKDMEKISGKVTYKNPKKLADVVNGIQLKNHKDTSQKPLYIVDGIELNNIDHVPDEVIETISVETGTAAIELFGEKAINGVVQIETKKENKPDINPGAGRVEIKGKVISGQDSKPIPGATVLFTANNKQLGTITNVNGEFLLQTDSQNVQLEFYSEGYLKKKMDWDGSKELVVMLESDKNATIPDRSANALKWEKMLRKAGIGKYPKGEEPIVIQNGYETLYNANDIAGLYNPDIIKNINYSKKTNIEIKRKELARNGYIEIKTTLPRQDKKLYIIDGEEVFMKNHKPSVYIYPKQLQMMKGLSKEEAVKKYGSKAKHGAVEITTKTNDDMSETDVSRVNDPLIVIDGIITGYKSIDHINPGDIQSITVLKGKKATELYGDKGNNGVFEVTMKPIGIYTELQFGRYIANEVRYPVLAQKSNLEKMVHLSVKINNDGSIEMISDDSIAADFSLDEVVVVSYKNQDNVVTGYPSKSAAEQAHKEKEQLFVDETKRVINRITKIDIDKFKGKTVGIIVKFVLQ